LGYIWRVQRVRQGLSLKLRVTLEAQYFHLVRPESTPKSFAKIAFAGDFLEAQYYRVTS
jgi:hypothetical protein